MLSPCFVKKSKIVILDEPTAHVDPATEQTVWRVVREKLKGFTVIIIAHRLKTIRDCDMILIMKNGQIVERMKFQDMP